MLEVRVESGKMWQRAECRTRRAAEWHVGGQRPACVRQRPGQQQGQPGGVDELIRDMWEAEARPGVAHGLGREERKTDWRRKRIGSSASGISERSGGSQRGTRRLGGAAPAG